MGAEAAALKNLMTEWQNKDHESMRPLLDRLLALKQEKTYEEAMYDVAMRVIPRHARDVNFVAHLLYLVDDRPYPVIHLQRICGIQEGHLYRTLRRAGVEYVAVQSKTIQMDDELTAWSNQIYADPQREKVYVEGKEYDFDDPESPVVVWLDSEDIFRVAYRDGGKKLSVPLPLLTRRNSVC